MTRKVGFNGKLRLKGNTVNLGLGFEVEEGGQFIAENNADMMLDFTPPTASYKSAMKSSASQLEIPHVEEIEEEEGILEKIQDELLLYPNPADEAVELQSASEMSRISVVNSEGVIVQQYDAAGVCRITVDVSDYPAGLYFISVTTNKGRVLVRKLMLR